MNNTTTVEKETKYVNFNGRTGEFTTYMGGDNQPFELTKIQVTGGGFQVKGFENPYVKGGNAGSFGFSNFLPKFNGEFVIKNKEGNILFSSTAKELNSKLDGTGFVLNLIINGICENEDISISLKGVGAKCFIETYNILNGFDNLKGTVLACKIEKVAKDKFSYCIPKFINLGKQEIEEVKYSITIDDIPF